MLGRDSAGSHLSLCRRRGPATEFTCRAMKKRGEVYENEKKENEHRAEKTEIKICLKIRLEQQLI